MFLEILAAIGVYSIIKGVKITYREDKPVEYRNINLVRSLGKITSSCYCNSQLGMRGSVLKPLCHICQNRGM